jgi:hypothetical protein
VSIIVSRLRRISFLRTTRQKNRPCDAIASSLPIALLKIEVITGVPQPENF